MKSSSKHVTLRNAFFLLSNSPFQGFSLDFSYLLIFCSFLETFTRIANEKNITKWKRVTSEHAADILMKFSTMLMNLSVKRMPLNSFNLKERNQYESFQKRRYNNSSIKKWLEFLAPPLISIKQILINHCRLLKLFVSISVFYYSKQHFNFTRICVNLKISILCLDC